MPPLFYNRDVTINPDDYRPSLPFDDLLRTIRLTGVIQRFVRVTSPWGCQLPRIDDCVTLHLVLSGSCVAYLHGTSDSFRLSAGDALLVPMPTSHVMADSTETPLIPLDKLISPRLKTANSGSELLAGLFSTDFSHGGGGTETQIVGVNIYVDKRFPIALLNNMPKLIPLRGFVSQHQDFLGHTLYHIREHGSQGFVGQAIATRLAEAVLTCAIRYYLNRVSQRNSRVRHDINDPVLSRVLGAIYQNPENDWNIVQLSDKAGLSRSAFLKRFARVTGQTPNAFITSLRMMRATELLEDSEASIAQIATKVGYGSEASFSRAFRRWCGTTPSAVKRRGR
ncbi:MAG TPA: AraC family transcriptional regulator [Paraburkholderia sp.]|uniref:AraC family transcriptional regulator n=1 Tax=Paraburkholderia sp. TaxID=1926495 RepID=UPI002B4926C5|nr:AraC family transcriptional regulator [Paraburkholderia sp.]HKR46997.1 AraC family transcriptional regulator [Paraburkholderia sp.]